MADRFLEHAPGGVDALADGAVQNSLVFRAIRDGGGYATVRGYGGELPRGIVNHPVWVRTYAQQWAKLEALRAQAELGAVSLRVAPTFPAEQAAEAHRLLEAGGIRGRLVLEF